MKIRLKNGVKGNILRGGLFFLVISIVLPCVAGQPAPVATTAPAPQAKSNFNQKLDEALSKLRAHKSFKLDFEQEFYSALRSKTSKSSGVLLVKAPTSFRFEIQKPRTELYVSNGSDFWKFLPSLNHAQHLKASALEMNYISLLTNPAAIKTSYNISAWTSQESKQLKQSANLSSVQSDLPPAESAEHVLIKLEPKGDKQQKVLYASVNVKKGLVEELRVIQLNGNRVRLLFSNYKDKDFATTAFSFAPPKGIVVDNN